MMHIISKSDKKMLFPLSEHPNNSIIGGLVGL